MSTNLVRFSPIASLSGLAGAHVRTGLCGEVALQQLPLPCLQTSLRRSRAGHRSTPSAASEGTRANRTVCPSGMAAGGAFSQLFFSLSVSQLARI